MVLFYTIDGEPYPDTEEGKLQFYKDKAATPPIRRSAVGNYLVSTVWLGLNHAFGNELPLIFETMIFNYDPIEKKVTDYLELYCNRYHTKAEAIVGHYAAIERASQLMRQNYSKCEDLIL